MNWSDFFHSSSFSILLVGSFVAASCALLGCFLVLRRMVLLGDALSHSVLPGIAIAFLLTGSLASFPMIIGAGTFGVLTVVLVQLLNRSGRLGEDASIGVVFPAFFALGVLIISRYARDVDLDIDCVLFGEIAYTPLDIWVLGGVELPRAAWVMGGILVFNVLLVTLLYKELKVTSFDPALAAALGLSPLVVHYILMSAVSVTVVGSFQSVGAILVVAMLVVPAATAFLLTRRLRQMLGLAVVLGVLSAWSGYAMAYALDCSIAGGMATSAGGFFSLAFLFAPRRGVVARAHAYRRLRVELSGQLLLLHLRAGGDATDRAASAHRFAWRARDLRRAVRPLLASGLVEQVGDGLRLTPRGERALQEQGTAPLAHRES